jgi:thymidine kinase
MYSGKSEELLRRLRRAEIAGHKVGVIKPDIDNRYDAFSVVSRAGVSKTAILVSSSSDIKLKGLGFDVLGVDEAQFFDPDIVDVLSQMSTRQVVIVSALDMTYRREPFGSVPILLAIADRVDKLTAVCHSCGADATLTQRLIDGKPASFGGPTVQVGGLESYEARCRGCFRAG